MPAGEPQQSRLLLLLFLVTKLQEDRSCISCWKATTQVGGGLTINHKEAGRETETGNVGSKMSFLWVTRAQPQASALRAGIWPQTKPGQRKRPAIRCQTQNKSGRLPSDTKRPALLLLGSRTLTKSLGICLEKKCFRYGWELDAEVAADRSAASRNFSEPPFSSLWNGDFQGCCGDQSVRWWHRACPPVGLLTPLKMENENPNLDGPYGANPVCLGTLKHHLGWEILLPEASHLCLWSKLLKNICFPFDFF